MHRPAIARWTTGGLLAVGLTLAAGIASACPFLPGRSASVTGEAAALETLPEGITTGWVRCPGEVVMPMVVWTLTIDPEAKSVGVRDAPLFRSMPLNPLIDVASIGLDDDAAFSLFARADQVAFATSRPVGPDTRPPHRLYGTLCARAAADRLDCDVRGRRLKARVDLLDSDQDGVLDIARHEVSILSGRRLQVLRFIVPHEPDPLDVVAQWVKAMEIAGFD